MASLWPPSPGDLRAGTAQASDVFISHASEDKDGIARPLAEALASLGVTVWFDELKIRVGMSIRRAVERGIADCRFGVVILSPRFFAKHWTRAELDGLYGRQRSTAAGGGFLLPIWYGITRDDVLDLAPPLADIHALSAAQHDVDELAERLAEVVLAGCPGA